MHTYCISQNKLSYAAVTNSSKISVTWKPLWGDSTGFVVFYRPKQATWPHLASGGQRRAIPPGAWGRDLGHLWACMSTTPIQEDSKQKNTILKVWKAPRSYYPEVITIKWTLSQKNEEGMYFYENVILLSKIFSENVLFDFYIQVKWGQNRSNC